MERPATTIARGNKVLTAEVEVEVPFQDADPMGVTWHGNYFRYIEVARSALLDRLGYNYRQMVASGFLWPVVDARIKYVRPTTFGQRVRVTATLAEYENRLKIAYTITDVASGDVVTEATTTQAAVHGATGEMLFVCPPVFTDRVKAALDAVGDRQK
ncbi:MAG: acyl-CoA thioesterase [Gammaproteobacteria bacterium]